MGKISTGFAPQTNFVPKNMPDKHNKRRWLIGRWSIKGGLSMMLTVVFSVGFSFMLAACSAPPVAIDYPAASPKPVTFGNQVQLTPLERDRLAILSLAGEHAVATRYRETQNLQTDRALTPAYNVYNKDVQEMIVVVSDEPGFISLQHIQVNLDGEVIKGERQDWYFEAKQLYRYRGQIGDLHKWELEKNAKPQVTGSWVQAVWYADESPAYQSRGRWQHFGNLSQWQGDRAAQPLPWREYTQRDDYQALSVQNRITITPTGWVLEQDNTKLVTLDPALALTAENAVLARETGVSRYVRVEDYPFQPGYDYWKKTGPFWADVRNWWQNRTWLAGEPNRLMYVRHIYDIQPLGRQLYDMAQTVNQQVLKHEQYVPDVWVFNIDQILQQYAEFKAN